MNITFLMGNGFDIGIGMPTQYEDFYKEAALDEIDAYNATLPKITVV